MLRILVVDSSPVSMALTVAVLERAGHPVTQAGRATTGIERARTTRPDVILIDPHLPDLDGAAAVRLLKADPRTAHIPVIALTAFAMNPDDDGARGAGCDGCLTKPIRYKEFAAELEKVMRRA